MIGSPDWQSQTARVWVIWDLGPEYVSAIGSLQTDSCRTHLAGDVGAGGLRSALGGHQGLPGGSSGFIEGELLRMLERSRW